MPTDHDTPVTDGALSAAARTASDGAAPDGAASGATDGPPTRDWMAVPTDTTEWLRAVAAPKPEPTRTVTYRTKIVATLGPATNTRDGLVDLIGSGMDVARINFSHGDHARIADTVALVRAVAEEYGRHVAILGDLQGPRIRVGALAAPVELVEGEEVVLAPESVATGDQIPVTHEQLADDVVAGNRVLINDGLFDLTVVAVEDRAVRCTVRYGGELTSNKGINLPGVPVSVPSLTDKDRADLAFAIEQDFDLVALSFVRTAEDIADLRALVPAAMQIVAKIEKDVALANLEAILEASDAAMIARGDLGVELPFEEVPIAQKRIIVTANRMGRPVITATQMLESMIEHPRPTRAEASDVANAILDGTDAVMLSAETAAGAYPKLAVQAMGRIIREVESSPRRPAEHRDERRGGEGLPTSDAIAAATVAAARMLVAPLVVVFTKSGFSARMLAAHRPHVPILVLTDQPHVARQLALVWGVIPRLVPTARGYDHMVGMALGAATEIGLVQPGDRVCVTAGVPFDVPGTTNLLKVEVV